MDWLDRLEPDEGVEADGALPRTIVVDDFGDDRARGTVIGTPATKGGIRHGCDVERQIAIDHGALRFQPLVRPGWGRQGIAYGPFQREAGLVLVVSLTNGHNTSQASPLPDDIARRFYRWLRGPGIDPWPSRLLALLRSPRKSLTARRFLWWALSTSRTYRGPNINENLAVGWFSSEAPINPLGDGCCFVVHAAEGENGELWARVGKRCLSAFRRLNNIHTYYVVALREQGAVYYAAADQASFGVAAFPMMRPIAVDPFNKDEKLFAGVHQAALGQIGFRVDTRVEAVHIGTIPRFATTFGSAHAADAFNEGLPRRSAAIGGPWRSWPDGADDISIVDPGRPSGLIHALLQIDKASGAGGLVWRFGDIGNYWLLKLSALGCSLVTRRSGEDVAIASNTEHGLREGVTHSVQILDFGGRVTCFLDGFRLFEAHAGVVAAETATGAGTWKTAESEIRWRSFEAHPSEVPVPSMAPLREHPQLLGTCLSYADSFAGIAGELEQRTTDFGDGQWTRTLGAGVIDLDGRGGACVRASVDRPNPGRTFYSLPWDLPGFSDLEVSILPPGERRGQDQRSRAGLLFWQDRDNYVCVTTWLDDVYPGASISVFIKRLGFEELYDAVWTNVADKVIWGKPFRMRVAFDGNRFEIFIDDEPVMQRSLTDIYPNDPALQIMRVGLAVNWEWGDDTGSVFTSFKARR
ncbi:oxidoreductase [Mesorhizobium sp. ES1-1]|uniref:oxidoreductase n=1 Tax=Mesorhizobium sp. ES1-1 TaxID=2876629 RepID=UPI001CCAD578|nr:oxidoreductase [Mesorhizobium sp. ES1-1]MBZ9677680.1 oxidoreductase [Mesorhizobium sp. ES1-1]